MVLRVGAGLGYDKADVPGVMSWLPVDSSGVRAAWLDMERVKEHGGFSTRGLLGFKDDVLA